MTGLEKVAKGVGKKALGLVKNTIQDLNGYKEIMEALKSLGENKEFINEILLEISNEIEINNENQQSQNQSIVNGVPFEQYNNCIIENNELKKEEQEFIVTFRKREEVLEGGTRLKKQTEHVHAFSKSDARNIIVSENSESEIKKIKIFSKNEWPRFTKKDIFDYWKKIKLNYNLTLNDFVFSLTDPLSSYSIYVTAFYKRYNIKSDLVALPNEKSFLDYKINDKEAEALREVLEEQEND